MDYGNTNDTLTKVCAILSPLFTVPIGPDDSTETLTEWDSLRFLEVIGVLEDTFEVEFTAQELVQLSSVKKIAEIINEKCGRG